LADRERGAQVAVAGIERERGLERRDRLGRRGQLVQVDRRRLARELAGELVILEQRQAAGQVARQRLPALGLAVELGEQGPELDRGLLVVEVDLDRGDRAVGLRGRQVALASCETTSRRSPCGTVPSKLSSHG